MTELERLRKVTLALQADMIALRAILPWMIGQMALWSEQEPPDAVRDLHCMALNTIDRWVIDADEKLAVQIREAAASSVDSLLSGIRLTPLPD